MLKCWAHWVHREIERTHRKLAVIVKPTWAGRTYAELHRWGSVITIRDLAFNSTLEQLGLHSCGLVLNCEPRTGKGGGTEVAVCLTRMETESCNRFSIHLIICSCDFWDMSHQRASNSSQLSQLLCMWLLKVYSRVLHRVVTGAPQKGGKKGASLWCESSHLEQWLSKDTNVRATTCTQFHLVQNVHPQWEFQMRHFTFTTFLLFAQAIRSKHSSCAKEFPEVRIHFLLLVFYF